jgi:hypothetical protein
MEIRGWSLCSGEDGQFKLELGDHFDRNLQTGHIYCNTINYFRSVEDNNKRGDINEGKTHIKQIKDLTLLIEGKPIARAERGQLYFENPDDKGNLFCLYGVKTELIDLTRSTGQK